MNKELIIAAISLGYRKHPKDSNKYIKPIGYNIFLLSIKDRVLSNWFYDIKNIFRCYNNAEIKSENYINISKEISYIENYNFKNLSFELKNEIGFITNEELFSIEN